MGLTLDSKSHIYGAETVFSLVCLRFQTLVEIVGRLKEKVFDLKI